MNWLSIAIYEEGFILKPISQTPAGNNINHASRQEVIRAIQNLDVMSKQRIAISARRILRRHSKLLTQMTIEDLIQEGLTLAIETRNWNPSKVDFPKFISGIMRSYASNEARKNQNTRPDVIFVEEREQLEASDVSETMPKTLTPLDTMIENNESAKMGARITMFRMMLSTDTEALSIFNLLLENTHKREIRALLKMTDKQYWAADRRLHRAVLKIGE